MGSVPQMTLQMFDQDRGMVKLSSGPSPRPYSSNSRKGLGVSQKPLRNGVELTNLVSGDKVARVNRRSFSETQGSRLSPRENPRRTLPLGQFQKAVYRRVMMGSSLSILVGHRIIGKELWRFDEQLFQ